MAARKVVLDTNVLVSALVGGSTRRWLDPALKRRALMPVFSPPLLDELRSVLSRAKLGSIDDREAFIQLVLERADVVLPVSRITACRDPKDNMVLECAVDGNVDTLVTGDNDLLALHPFRGIAILSPAAFVKDLLR